MTTKKVKSYGFVILMLIGAVAVASYVMGKLGEMNTPQKPQATS